MHVTEVDATAEYIARLEHGADWREQIEDFATENDITAAWFIGLGAVQDAEVWFYDQETYEYDPVRFDEPLEVTNCTGNISLLNDNHFAHTHATFSRPSGQAIAGHLDRATVWAGELYIREFDEELVREHDPATDLDLWL